MLFDRIHKLLGGDIGSQINDLEAGALKHHGHQVFADIMQITFHRTDQTGAHTGRITF